VTSIRVAIPLDPSTEMGPLISAGSAQRRFVPRRRVPVAFRGSAPEGDGYWFAPTVLAPTDRDARVMQEEVFGPVVAVMRRDEEDAVQLANDTIYGSPARSGRRDGARALRVPARSTAACCRSTRNNRCASRPPSAASSSPATDASSGRARSTLTPRSSRSTTQRHETRRQGLRRYRCERGIGASSVELFQREGAKVVGVDLLADTPGDLALVVDVTDEQQVIDMYKKVRDEFGRIDVLFNNAGISPTDDGSVLETTLEAYQRVQDVN